MAVTWPPRRGGQTSALPGAQGRRAAEPKAGSAMAPVTLGQPCPRLIRGWPVSGGHAWSDFAVWSPGAPGDRARRPASGWPARPARAAPDAEGRQPSMKGRT